MAVKPKYCVLGNAMNAEAMGLDEDISPLISVIAISAFLCLMTILLF